MALKDYKDYSRDFFDWDFFYTCVPLITDWLVQHEHNLTMAQFTEVEREFIFKSTGCLDAPVD